MSCRRSILRIKNKVIRKPALVIVAVVTIVTYLYIILTSNTIDGTRHGSPTRQFPRLNTSKQSRNGNVELNQYPHGTQSPINQHVHINRYDKLPYVSYTKTYTSDLTDEKGNYAYFKDDFKTTDREFPSWFRPDAAYCGDRFIGYGKKVVVLNGVEIHPERSRGKVGGENINDVIGQELEKEYFRLEPGYFVMHCSDYEFDYSKHTVFEMKDMLHALIVKPEMEPKFNETRLVYAVTIVTKRHEYANFYHMMMAWYSIFLIMVRTHTDPDNMAVIWLDSHPRSGLDDTWFTLYNTNIRAGAITEQTYFKYMIWDTIVADSPINIHRSRRLPFYEEFRHFFLSKHGIEDKHTRDCKKLNIVIIWRRDHVSHPRNPSGLVTRKISNENEVILAVNQAIPTANVSGVQLEKLSMTSQLNVITKTDILIGTHGAGLSHIIFLRKTAGVIEIMPSFVSAANSHFRAMARFYRLPYLQWRNSDPSIENRPYSINIPADSMRRLVLAMKYALCEG